MKMQMNCKDSTRRAPPRLWRIARARPLNRMPPRFRNYNIHAEQHFSRGKKWKHFFFRTAWEKGFGEGVGGVLISLHGTIFISYATGLCN